MSILRVNGQHLDKNTGCGSLENARIPISLSPFCQPRGESH